MKLFPYPLLTLLSFCLLSLPAIAEWDEAKALEVLASDTEEKARACQALAVVGGPESVPALAALLDDPQLASYARTALEVIDHPSAGDALREALPNVRGRLLVGVVTSLGVRRDEAAVPALQELTSHSDTQVAKAAISALARIGTGPALDTVKQALKQGPYALRISAAHAALAASEDLIQNGQRNSALPLLDSVTEAVIPDYIKQAAAALRSL